LGSLPTSRSFPDAVAAGAPEASPAGRRRGLITRVATAAIGMPVTVAAVVLGGPWLFAGVAAIAVLGTIEFYRMVERAGYRPVWEAGIGAGVLFALDAAWPQPWQAVILPGLLLYVVSVYVSRGRPDRVLGDTAVTMLGAVYVGYLMAYALRLRALAGGGLGGAAAALLVIFSVWGADSAAYFVGVAAGRRKLSPQVSPNKSVEGALAGVAAGLAVALACGAAFRIPLALAAAVGAVCAVAGIVGDLWESAIKREIGIKDAGGILPGHGGILDRFDGLLFAMPVGYVLMRWWRAW
jgi:phosphatidate cytidylyltransferase